MPQADKYRNRVVPIEFSDDEKLKNLPSSERLTLVLITKGAAELEFNGCPVICRAPFLLYISNDDRINVSDDSCFSAISFSFAPTFINTTLTFEALKENAFTNIEDEHDRNAIIMFLARDEQHTGRQELGKGTYLQLLQWMNCIGTEIYAQSDGAWTCRIRRWLLQILYLGDDMLRDGGSGEQLPEVKAYEYINTNYREDITLDALCRISGVNRTTLSNRFKARYGVTVSKYLQSHRIKMACEILAHTNLTLSEIAEETGFKYDTYFIKQFKKIKGISPTDYRNYMRATVPGLNKSPAVIMAESKLAE